MFSSSYCSLLLFVFVKSTYSLVMSVCVFLTRYFTVTLFVCVFVTILSPVVVFVVCMSVCVCCVFATLLTPLLCCVFHVCVCFRRSPHCPRYLVCFLVRFSPRPHAPYVVVFVCCVIMTLSFCYQLHCHYS